jgi:hypothetical protein
VISAAPSPEIATAMPPADRRDPAGPHLRLADPALAAPHRRTDRGGHKPPAAPGSWNRVFAASGKSARGMATPSPRCRPRRT